MIVPGLGAVLAQTLPAHFDPDTSTFYPPVREFSFNGALTRSDGLLITSVSRARGISYEAASRLVSEEADAMRMQLADQGCVSLGRIGELRRDASGTVIFSPGPMPALDPSYQWLPAFNITPVVLVKDDSRTHQGDRETPARPRRWMRRLSTMAKIAASVAAFAAIGYMLSTPSSIEDVQFASLGIEQFSAAKQSTPAEPPLVQHPGTTTSALVLVLSAHDDSSTTVDTAEYNRRRLEHLRARTAPKVRGDRYCYVIASLGSRDEAERYIRRSGMQDLGILDKDGRFRVYAATGATSAEVLDYARSKGLDRQYPSAWVCRR